MKKVLKTMAQILAFLSAILGALNYYEITTPAGAALALPKIVAGAISPFLALMGVLGAALGALTQAPLAVNVGLLGAAASARHTQRVIAPHDGFAKVFGPDWQDRIHPKQWSKMQKKRWTWLRPRDNVEPRWERDVVFWTLPAEEGEQPRELLCDIWQPPAGVEPSGLAFVYFHGSGWHWLNKDWGTRSFFQHLAAQGHVVMDVAYRLCPETDLFGMLGDVKRAVAWMKKNASRFGVNPARVVAAGGSAGGHLALLAGYTPGHPRLTPAELKDVDTSVRAIVSYYGPTDMWAYHRRAGSNLPSETSKPTGLLGKLDDLFSKFFEPFLSAEGQETGITHPQMMTNLLGGMPEAVPEIYDLASPVSHVIASCPPTLLLQGEHDMLVCARAARTLYHKLTAAGVPAVHVEFPLTEHAFDVGLMNLTQNSPAAQAALYDVDRFLALMV